MAYSGNIDVAQFNALKVVDHAYRRCRLPAQAITSEMQAYALESLGVLLSDLANSRTPSWCIERVVLPMYENQPIVTLPQGTVDVLNLNYRVIEPLGGTATVTTSTSYTVDFTTATQVAVVGVKWLAAAVPVSLQTSPDGTTWTTVGTMPAGAAAGEIAWVDIAAPMPQRYFRLLATSGTLSTIRITLGNTPQEIPFGALNRDAYVAQSNKIFPGRPTNYYFQRLLPRAVVNLWPAPFAAAEQAQLVLWRHRYIMDTDNLQQEVEIPRRWLEAIIDNLALRVGIETPQVTDVTLARLELRAPASLQRAWDGDGDGSPIQINPGIAAYTK